jgi:hypothetical protein
MRGRICIEPESHVIEEMKTGKVDEHGPTWPFVRPEEDRGGENPLKPSHQAPVIRTVFGEAKEIEHLGC